MTRLPDPERSRVILVGASDYKNFENLPAVANNLTGMARVLTSPSICGIQPAAVTVISEPLNPAEILDATYEAAESCTDTLIFYFAGHGLTSPHGDELLLAMPDTDPRRPHSAVRFDDVRMAILSGRKAPRKLVVLDCCFSGRAMMGTMSNSQDLAARSEVEGSYILTAASETKTALAPPGEDFTAFTGEFLTLLEHGSADGPPDLDMGTIYSHLHGRLSAQSRPLPQQRNRNAGASIILARNMHPRSDFSATKGDISSIVDYMHESTKASMNPKELRAELLGEHLPYAQRIRTGITLAKFFPEFRSEVCQVLVELGSESDLEPSDRVHLLGAMADLGWSPQTAKEELLRIAKTPHHGMVSLRSDACGELRRLKEKEMAIEGYMSIIMDSEVGISGRAIQAQIMAKYFPEQKNAALRLLWSAGKDKSLSASSRIEILRKIYEVDSDALDQVAALIRGIKSGRPSSAP
ncbi:caspase family protein [Streptomyces sp. A0642]|uniref:caspase family protein n=1 Tax=Streptomyces sp. A0642 TaxID=2563100 RepID=UPI001445F9F3|nr:caspase family protein [Streptomyces sp. A0642]